jgi:bifunctional non-homologous end joining protein LigD
MMLTWPRSLHEGERQNVGKSNMERSHIDTTWKQNTMQVFFTIRAFLIKLDGYRAIAFKTGGQVHLRSRNDNDFAGRYPVIAKALEPLPDETVIDGEVVALDERGKPSFSLLQNHGSSRIPLIYYAFDLMVLAGKPVMAETLEMRRHLLEEKVLPKLAEPIRYSVALEASLADLIRSVKAQGFEGLVAKRRSSGYEPNERSGAATTRLAS